MDSYSIIIKPHVTEKTMNLIDKNNEITFVVKRDANKSQIKRAFEELYEEKVARVTTHITPRGNKVAFIKLVEEEMAEELEISINGIRYYIKKLKKAERLIRVGSTKKGHWKIDKKEKRFSRQNETKNIKL